MINHAENRNTGPFASNGPAKRLLVGSVSAAAMIVGFHGAVMAQEAAPAAKDTGLADIIVTAQKREQRLQDVPVAVTAVSQSAIQANRVVSIMDLTGLAPGMVARANAGALGSPSFAMRGVYATASQPSSDRQISTYIDGVYIGSSRGGVFDLPDIQQIEVLRGPQGTLIGRNATAGAVSITTRDPSGKFGLRQDFTVGNYDQFRSRTTLETPQFGSFSAYVTFVHDERRGDTRNLGAGTTWDRTSPFTNQGVATSPEWLGGHNNNDVFAALKFAPSSNFKAVYKFDYSHSTFTPEARADVLINPNDFTGGLLLGVIAAQSPGGGAFGPINFDPSNRRPDAVNNSWTVPGYQTVYGHNLTMKWQAANNLSFKNITAYRHSQVFGPSTIMGIDGLVYTAAAKAFLTAPQAFLGGASYAQAFYGAAAPYVTGAPIGSYFAGYEGNSYGDAWQVSDELQANYQSKLLTLTVGAIYYHSFELSSGLPGMNSNFSFAPTPQQLPLGNVQESTSTATSWAGYAQAEVHVLPKLDIVLGGRVTSDKKNGALNLGGTFTGTRTAGTITGQTLYPWNYSKTKPTYSVGANYKAADDILLYGKYSTAFMAGGAVGQLSFAPETVSSAEAGIKSEWFDRHLMANLSLYTATYDHTQSSQSGFNVGLPFSVVVIDNGTLQAKGFELELSAAPAKGLTLGASAGYTDAHLDNPNQLAAQGRPYVISAIPKWTGNINAQYDTMPVVGDAYLSFRMDGNYQGKYRVIPYTDVATHDPEFVPYMFNPATWLVNGRVALKNVKVGSASAEVAVWARNLFDNKNPIAELPFASIQIDSSFQPARTFGLDINLKL